MKGIGTFVLLLLLGLGTATYLLTRPRGRGATATELSWIRDDVGWWKKAEDRVTHAYTRSRPDSPDRNARVLEPLRSCFESLARDAGAPPDLLKPVEQAAKTACEVAQFALRLNHRYGLAGLASTSSICNEQRWHSSWPPDGSTTISSSARSSRRRKHPLRAAGWTRGFPASRRV